MKRIIMWLASTCTIVVLLFGYRTSTNSTTAAATSIVTNYGATAATPSSTTAGSASSPSAGTTAAGTTAAGTTAAGTTITGNSGSTTSATAAAPSVSAPAAGTSSAPASTTATSAASAPISYTGAVAQTRWGPVQVQIAVTGSRVTAVDVLEYPSGNGKDQQINAYALPILVEETVDAQSAKIDMVSGATVTSDGYVESLQSALDQAGL